jgi:hypothetical protein
MPTRIPKLQLSHGQAAWTLSRGRPADQEMLDRVRYLRQLGVPFDEAEAGRGRGHRVYYGFEELMEMGVALFAMRRGIPAKETAVMLTAHRSKLRHLYRKALRDQPHKAIEAPWVKSRGALAEPIAEEIFLRLHDGYSAKPGTIDVLAAEDIFYFGPAERYPGEATRTLLPLTRLVLELVAWALDAPETRPGPQ